ncbi:S24 family peptidase [Paraherbaspirillum soli]|uniref:Helix-turn-helix transcriptional regulator n=1 Tax=Paraherbaspirillum soli TaxID=631222 RepID=A0ABW0MDX4_9BURK
MKTIGEIRRDNLLYAIERFKKAERLARTAHVSAAYISQLKNCAPESSTGKVKNMGDDVARRIEIALGEPIGWMDTSHKHTAQQERAVYPADNNLDETTLVVSNAAIPMGLNFSRPESTHIVETMNVTRAWVRGNLTALTGTENLAILSASGDSMAPTFNDGDLLLVDRGVREIHLDAIYVISRNNELFIKRVRQRLQDGAIIIKSDNPLYGPDDIVEHAERDQLVVLGRVVWAWNARKL